MRPQPSHDAAPAREMRSPTSVQSNEPSIASTRSLDIKCWCGPTSMRWARKATGDAGGGDLGKGYPKKIMRRRTKYTPTRDT